MLYQIFLSFEALSACVTGSILPLQLISRRWLKWRKSSLLPLRAARIAVNVKRIEFHRKEPLDFPALRKKDVKRKARGREENLSLNSLFTISIALPFLFPKMAGTAGFEPVISALTGQRVNQATPRPQSDLHLCEFSNYTRSG